MFWPPQRRHVSSLPSTGWYAHSHPSPIPCTFSDTYSLIREHFCVCTLLTPSYYILPRSKTNSLSREARISMVAQRVMLQTSWRDWCKLHISQTHMKYCLCQAIHTSYICVRLHSFLCHDCYNTRCRRIPMSMQRAH